MPDPNFELQQLAMADRHIERGEKIVADQELELMHLRLKDYDIELAERTLAVLEDSLQTMYRHRNMIVRTIQQIDRGLI